MGNSVNAIRLKYELLDNINVKLKINNYEKTNYKL